MLSALTLDLRSTSSLLQRASADSFGTEFMDYKMAVKTIASLDEALAHIAQYGSGHSESIITNDEARAREFQTRVDAACVYWNAPLRSPMVPSSVLVPR